MPSVTDMIKGMPHSQQGRGRHLYDLGKQDGRAEAVVELEKQLEADHAGTCGDWIKDSIYRWAQKMTGGNDGAE